VHLGIGLSDPCPVCGPLAQNPEVGDNFNCSGGPRNGQPCTVDAVSPEFGGTSSDCPPASNTNVSGVGLAIKFGSVSTGTRTLDAVLPCGGSLAGLHPSNGGAVCLDTATPCSTNSDCQRCTGDPTTACTSNADCTGAGSCAAAPAQPVSCGVYCHCGFCDGNPDAPCFSDAECAEGETCEQGIDDVQQLQGNKCTDLTCGLGGFEQCCSDDDPSCANPTALVGECVDQPFRGCANNTDCTNAGASGPCNLFNRPCFENQIARTGTPSPLGSYCTGDPNETTCTTNADCATGQCVPDSSEPTTVALFCVPPTSSSSINAAGGIPGPGAITFKSAIISYRCGNGVTEGVEECDDNNNTNGDGCNEICETE
jgi:cysteine-rich repeat protein